MNKPAALPSFATDPTLTGGPQVGLSTRLSPGAGTLAQGFYQGRRLPARALSYVLGTHGDWLTYLDGRVEHDALRRWQRTVVSGGGAGAPWTNVVGMQPVRSFDTNGERQRMPLLLGPTGGTRLGVALSNDGSVFETPRTINAGTAFSVTAAAACKPGEAIAIDGATADQQYTTDHGSSWTVNATAFPYAAVHYVPNSGIYLALDTHGNFYRGTVIGTITTAITLAMTAADPAISEFADDNGSNVVLVSRINGHGFASIFHSADGGLTWAFVQNFAGFFANITYSKALGLFFAWDDAGTMQTSTTGAAWTSIASGLTTAKGFLAGNKTLACVGPAIVKLWSYQPSANFTQRGIAYSLDGTATWNTYAFGEVPVGGSAISQLRAINNRLYVVDAVGLWSSGALDWPLPEI